MSKIGDTFGKIGAGVVPQAEAASYVTLRTTMNYLGVGASTVARLAEGGHLTLKTNGQTDKHGTRYRFPMAEVVALKGKIDNGGLDLRPFKNPNLGRKRGHYTRTVVGASKLWQEIGAIKQTLTNIDATLRAMQNGQGTTTTTRQGTYAPAGQGQGTNQS